MEIIPHFWIAYYDNYYIDIIKQKNIKNIIHISKNEPFTKRENIEEIRIPIDYNDNDSLETINNVLYQQLFDITDYIHDKIINNEKVLLLGYNYKQDIDNITVAYLIRFGKLTVKEAIFALKSKKNDIFIPKIMFYNALNKFYNELNKNI